MMIDATFWVAVSFFIFLGLLVHFKIPHKIKNVLEESIFVIKSDIDDAEKLKDEAKNFLGEHEQKLSNSKKEIKSMIEKANGETKKNVIKTNEDFHILMENKKKNVEQKINQMKDQALKDIRNISVKIAITSVERLLKNSLDKSKLDKLYSSSIEETKVALNKKSS